MERGEPRVSNTENTNSVMKKRNMLTAAATLSKGFCDGALTPLLTLENVAEESPRADGS